MDTKMIGGVAGGQVVTGFLQSGLRGGHVLARTGDALIAGGVRGLDPSVGVGDAVVAGQADQPLLGQERVQLDLQHRGLDRRVGHQVIQETRVVVADADLLREPCA